MAIGLASRTARRRGGDISEEQVARHLLASGWTVVACNLVVGRDEIDLLAVDPGPTETLVFVEVRGNRTGRFGAPEESVVGRKLARTYRAALAARRSRIAPLTEGLMRLPWRVDVLVIEHRPALARGIGGPVLRHLRGVAPD